MELKYGVISFLVTVLFYAVLFLGIYRAEKNKENGEEFEKLLTWINYIPISLLTVGTYIVVSIFCALNALMSIVLFYLAIWLADRLYYLWSKNVIELENKLFSFYLGLFWWIVYLVVEELTGTDYDKYHTLLIDTLGLAVGLVIPIKEVLSRHKIKDRKDKIVKVVEQILNPKIRCVSAVVMTLLFIVLVVIDTLKDEYKNAIWSGFLVVNILIVLILGYKKRKNPNIL